MSAGIKKMEALRAGGFTDEEVDDWRSTTAQELQDAGFSHREVDDYFGVKEPDMGELAKFFEGNLTKLRGGGAAKPPGGDQTSGSAESLPGYVPQEGNSSASGDGGAGPVPTPPKPAESFLEVLEAGWDMSVTGLISGAPDVVLPENAPMFHRIASQVSTLAGDAPFMVAGAAMGTPAGTAAGGAAGTAVLPGPGTVAGAAVGGVMGGGAGAFALPTAIREILVQHYQKGDIKNFRDFWERASATFIETSKSAIIGAATAGTGAAARVAVKAVAQPAVRTAAQVSAEVATMVSVGAALEGEVPSSEHFIEAALLVGGLRMTIGAAKPIPKVAQKVTAKLQRIYAETGLKPEQVAGHAMKDPALREQLLASGPGIPAAYEAMVQTGSKAARPVVAKVDANLGELSSVVAKDSKTGLKIEPFEPAQPQQAGAGGKGEPPARPQAEQAVLDRISQADPKKEPLTFDQFYFKVVDDLHPIKQAAKFLAGEKGVAIKDDPYVRARLSRGSVGMADHMIEIGTFDFVTRKTNGPGLKTILEPVKKELDTFRAFSVAARVVELEARGIKTGVDLESAKATYRAGKSKYGESFAEVVEYQNKTLQYLRDSGILSKEAHAEMVQANQNYVPFFRLMDQGKQAKVDSKGLRVKNPIKEIKGSERMIVDPIESIIKNTYAYTALAERNNVLVKLVELAEKNPEFATYTDAKGNALMEKVPAPQRAIEVKSEEISKFLEEHGLEASAEAMTIFRPGSVQLAPNEVQVYRNGKREIWKMAPELAESVKALDRESSGILMKMLSVPASTLRAGAVLSPDFIGRNLVRDQFSAFINSNNKFVPVADALVGMRALFSKKSGDAYSEWLKHGGANAAMVAMDRQYISQKVFQLNEQTGFVDQVRNVVKSPIEMLRVTSELIENATRLGDFKKGTAGGKSGFEAAFESRELTLDFARKGAHPSIRAMNIITAFWNAQLQGIDRTARAFKDDPVRTSAKTMAAITVPSVLLYMANKDDPRWADIPRWQKDMFWIVMTDEHIFRIPKPHDVGLMFGSVPERTLEAFAKDNPKAFDEFSDSLVGAFTPGYMPTFATPIVEHFANRSTFTGGPIIPAQLEGILPEYQYTERTTETAKSIGKIISNTIPGGRTSDAASPILIENYVRAWSGNLGVYALQLAEKTLEGTGVVVGPPEPAAQLAELPVIRAFMIRHPSASTQPIVDFHERHRENKRIVDTIRHLARTGDFDNLEAELLLQENQSKLVALDQMSRSLSNMHKMIRLIHKHPELTPPEKREDIDQLYDAMNETAKLGNTMFDELEKALKPKK